MVKIDLNKAKFRRDTPKTGVRYALDVAGPYGIDRERNENYAQMGWDYVTTLALSMASFMYYVYRSDDPQAPALHTDPVTQGGTITALIRRKRRNLALMLVLLLFILRTDVITLFTAPWAIPRFTILYTERAVQWLALMIPYLLLLFLPEVRMLRALGKLRRQLLDGIPLERERRWPRRFPSPPAAHGNRHSGGAADGRPFVDGTQTLPRDDRGRGKGFPPRHRGAGFRRGCVHLRIPLRQDAAPQHLPYLSAVPGTVQVEPEQRSRSIRGPGSLAVRPVLPHPLRGDRQGPAVLSDKGL